MKIKLYKIGKVSAGFEKLAGVYLMRAEVLIGLEAKVVKNDTAILTLMDKKDQGQWVFCDERGDTLTSQSFAKYLSGAIADPGIKQLNFVVGGPFGFGDELKERIQKRLSLSLMTFPNEMAWLILCEQIYRGMSIISGLSYHH